MQSFAKNYYGGKIEQAYSFAANQGEKSDLLWNMQAGISAFQLGKDDSDSLLNVAEVQFSKYESEGLLSGVFDTLSSAAVNDNILPYRGYIYEGVLLNYYKALAAMSRKDFAIARVEFNRANDRQRRAKDYFSKDITKAISQQEKDFNQKTTDANQPRGMVDLTANSSSQFLENEYSNLSAFKAYHSFINPSVSYISGLFFMLENDYSKALDLFKESYAINKASLINEDVAILKKRQMRVNSSHTWILIEEGHGAYKQEKIFSFPAYLVSDKVLNVSVALPVLTAGSSVFSQYRLGHGASFEEIANMDSVIAREYQEQLPFVLARALAGAILKMYMQAELAKQFGDAGVLFGGLYSIMATGADVRISLTTPYRILATRVKNQQKDIAILGDGHSLFKINFQFCGDDSHKMSKIVTTKVKKAHQDAIILCNNQDNILYLRVTNAGVYFQLLKGEMK